MKRKTILTAHIIATSIAVLTIGCFFSFSIIAEIVGNEEFIKHVKKGILGIGFRIVSRIRGPKFPYLQMGRAITAPRTLIIEPEHTCRIATTQDGLNWVNYACLL